MSTYKFKISRKLWKHIKFSNSNFATSVMEEQNQHIEYAELPVAYQKI